MVNRSKVLAVSLIVATFVAGGLVGSVVSSAWGGKKEGAREPRGPRPSYSERLQRDLGLSTAQRDSLEVILRRREAAIDQVWRDNQPRFDSLRAQIRSEIRALLDEAQRSKYDSLIARAHAARRDQPSRGGRDGRNREGRDRDDW